MMQALIDTAWTESEVKAFRRKLQDEGFRVLDLEAGHCAEMDGQQVWRATQMGADNYLVRLNERMFPDV